jgi:hypothetical protein
MGDRGQFAIPFFAFLGAHMLIAPRAINHYLHVNFFLQVCKIVIMGAKFIADIKVFGCFCEYMITPIWCIEAT